MTCGAWSANRSTKHSSATSAAPSPAWCATKVPRLDELTRPGRWIPWSLGHDMRASSPALSNAFAEGVIAQGLDVVRIGLASTDQLVLRLGSAGSARARCSPPATTRPPTTASSCAGPGPSRSAEDTGLVTIGDEVIDGVPAHDGAAGTITDRDVLAEYGDFLALAGRPVGTATAAGGRRRRKRHGRAHHPARCWRRFPGSRCCRCYFELDGTFPNHEANPLDPANLVDLQAHVLATGADIGLAFDGDADRCFVVDELGLPISPSAVTALVAARELGREIGATVIHNLITSRRCPS